MVGGVQSMEVKVPLLVRVLGFLLSLCSLAAGLFCASLLLLAWMYLQFHVTSHQFVFVSGILAIGVSLIATVQLAWLPAINRLWWFAGEVAVVVLFFFLLSINKGLFH